MMLQGEAPSEWSGRPEAVRGAREKPSPGALRGEVPGEWSGRPEVVRGAGEGPGAGALPLLFLVADTGGGHRSAARAVVQALDHAYPGRFAPVLFDPLGGPDSPRLLRRVTGLYGPITRLAPPLWGAVYHGSSSRAALGLLRSTLFALADRTVAAAVARHRPAAILSFHPLLCRAAVRAGVPFVMTVVTDLITAHPAWHHEGVDRIAVPSRAVRPPGRRVETGLPVTAGFWGGRDGERERAALRRSLGVPADRFLIVVTGGGEGSGGIAGRVAAILGGLDDDVVVVTVCGRNRALYGRLTRQAARAPGRLVVRGFVADMADWMRCADVVVTKAGPSTIAEATCCGTPLVLTSHLPGQEKGNIEFVVDAGAGRRAATDRELVAVLDGLRRDPGALEAMRAASARLGRPDAAARVADLVAAQTLTPVRSH